MRVEYNQSVAFMKQRLKKGDKVKTAAGNIETVIRTNSNGNVETIESNYSWSTHNLIKL